MAKIFSASTIKNVTIPNRIVMPPMCQYTASEDGKVSEWHKVHYGARAIGKVGLIILEATAVEPRGRITDNDLGIWENGQISGLQELVEFGHRQGSVMAIQLGHAGRKSMITDQATVIAPSAIPFDEKSITPVEMTKETIGEVVQAFRDAARRADQAGFDLLEIHGAHGYLIHEFLSPISNQRVDEYGGTRLGRVRLLQEIVQAIQKEWPKEKPLILRISATDYLAEGIDVKEMVEILKIVKEEGIDLIHVSSGGLVPAKINLGPGYQIRLSEIIKQEVGLPTIAVGLITEPELAEEILQNERADYVAIGRELLSDPHWVLKAAKKLGSELEWPLPYARAKR